MNYEQSIKILTSTNKFIIQLGLERIKSVLELIGNPQDKIKIIHVAGTNGKGSVCAALANILKYSGYKTGLYTSPHLIEYTERIKIDGKQISETEFALLLENIDNTAKKAGIELSEFEILTAMAFKYFADNNVDIAIIETGLGGRFDATNAINKPLCSIITSISLDHTDRLGDSIEKIAYEKAGIIKKGAYVIISPQNKGYNVIKEQAEKVGARLVNASENVDVIFESGKNYAVYKEKNYEFSLLGLYQKSNLELVFKTLELLKDLGYTIKKEEGLKTVKWAGRFEYDRERNILTDGAHNPDGAKELKRSLDYYFGNEKRIFIYGTINTKDYKQIAQILFRPDDEVYYYEFEHKNAISYEEYRKNVSFEVKTFTLEVLKKNELKVVTGSLYMIGEFCNKWK